MHDTRSELVFKLVYMVYLAAGVYIWITAAKVKYADAGMPAVFYRFPESQVQYGEFALAGIAAAHIIKRPVAA